jgi:hypothetical protein
MMRFTRRERKRRWKRFLKLHRIMDEAAYQGRWSKYLRRQREELIRLAWSLHKGGSLL